MRYKVLTIISAMLITACSTVYVVPNEVFDTEITKTKLNNRGTSISAVSLVTLPLAGILVTGGRQPRTNGMKWISAITEMGDTVFVEVKPDSELRIYLNDGSTKSMLACTAFMDKDVLKGSKSILMGMPTEVNLEDILEVKIRTGGAIRTTSP